MMVFVIKIQRRKKKSAQPEARKKAYYIHTLAGVLHSISRRVLNTTHNPYLLSNNTQLFQLCGKVLFLLKGIEKDIFVGGRDVCRG